MSVIRSMWKHILVLLLTLALLVLSVAVTLSWMESGDHYEGKRLEMAYKENSRYVIGAESVDIDVRLYTKDAAGNYVVADTKENEPLFTAQNMLPADAVYFMLEFYNNGETNIKTNIYFAGVNATVNDDSGKPKLSEALYLSLTGSEGYPDRSEHRPDGTFEKVTDVLEYTTDSKGVVSGRLTLAEGLTIPPTGKGADATPIKIYGYLLFDRNAGSEYQNCDFNVDSILIVT